MRQAKLYYQFVGSGIAIVASTYGLSRYVFGLFIPVIKEDFNLSIELIGVIASSSYVGFLIAMAISSIVSVKLGPRFTILLGGVTASSGLAIIAFSTNQWMLSLGVIIAGMSPGFAYPPLSDAIVLMIDKKKRDLAYSIINSGTSVGIIFSVPVALFAGSQWRVAWIVFAIIALLSTIWNYLVVTKKKITAIKQNTGFNNKLKWLFSRSSHKLFIYAFFLGIVTSSYWVFSVEYITTKNPEIIFFHWQVPAEIFTKLFWIIVGISGLLGGGAGFFVKTFGLKKMLQVCTLLIVISMIVLTAFSYNFFGMLFSALIFGGIFILMTALVGIWSIFVFYENPSAGFGMAFLILSIGQMVGPVFWGIIINQYSMEVMFYISAFIGFVFSFVKPVKDIYSMTPNIK